MISMGTIKNQMDDGVPAGKKIETQLKKNLKINKMLIQKKKTHTVIIGTNACAESVIPYGNSPKTLKKNKKIRTRYNQKKKNW
jgi:hypothetical protein